MTGGDHSLSAFIMKRLTFEDQLSGCVTIRVTDYIHSYPQGAKASTGGVTDDCV